MSHVSEATSRDRASICNLFVLIYALDYLKNVLHGPRLFLSVLYSIPLSLMYHKDSKLKSSLDIARKLSSLSLAGEGDIGRRLHSITKTQLTHSQYPLDDFDYRIINLATDLRDGIRLAKLLEIWAGRNNCSQQLRYPANGMPHKIHNLSVAFTAVQAEGISISMENGEAITPCDIATGNRERTLFLLWRLIGHWQLPRYLKTIHLGDEIRYLKKLLTIRGITLPTVKVYSH
jgi:abnormal spindle-like microcephaly-associated protein